MPRSLREQINKQQDFDSPEEEAMLNIARTAAHLEGVERAFFRQFELTPQSYNLLRILRGHLRQGKKDGVRASEIGGQMIVRMPDVTRLVDRMCDRSLVGRGDCATDKRVKYVFITKDGLELLQQIDLQIGSLHKQALGHLSKQELCTISKLMVSARQENHHNQEGQEHAKR